MESKNETAARKKLQETAARDPAFRRFLHALKERQREPVNRETPLAELTNVGESAAKAVKCFRLLQEAGYGVLKLGRRSLRTRFVWATSVKEVATQLIGDPDNPQPGSPRVPSAGSHTHTFLLRPGLVVVIELPLDLAADEARRLAEFVRSLPFEHEVRSQDATPTAED